MSRARRMMPNQRVARCIGGRARGVERQVSDVALPNWDDVTALREKREGPCVSIYMPVHRKGKDTEQDPLRLRNLLDAAEEELGALGERGMPAAEILKPARDLLGEQRPFRSQQQDGLAIFLAPGWARILRLPFDVPEMLVTGSRFHLRPLAFGLQPDQEFYVLTLNRRGVRLLRGSRFDLEAVELSGIPTGVDEVLTIVESWERQFQARTGTRRGDQSTPIFHGHGLVRDTENERLLEYFRAVDKSVLEVLRDADAPLVLAGIGYLIPLFREATSYGRVLEQAAEGNTETLDDTQLHARTWTLVEPLAAAESRAKRERYEARAAKGEASCGLERVLKAALQGRVETLFVANDEFRWGRFDDQSGKARQHEQRRPGDEELLDRALVETMANGGRAYALARDEMPEQAGVAAIFRY